MAIFGYRFFLLLISHDFVQTLHIDILPTSTSDTVAFSNSTHTQYATRLSLAEVWPYSPNVVYADNSGFNCKRLSQIPGVQLHTFSRPSDILRRSTIQSSVTRHVVHPTTSGEEPSQSQLSNGVSITATSRSTDTRSELLLSRSSERHAFTAATTSTNSLHSLNVSHNSSPSAELSKTNCGPSNYKEQSSLDSAVAATSLAVAFFTAFVNVLGVWYTRVGVLVLDRQR